MTMPGFATPEDAGGATRMRQSVAPRRKPPGRWPAMALGLLLGAGVTGGAALVLLDGVALIAAVQAASDDAGTQMPREHAQAGALARSTLVALDHASLTGNYAVLRELAAPAFQPANSAADLARIFAGLRGTGIDLSMAALAEPRWAAEPSIGPDQLLRLAGTIGSGAGEVRFALAYQAVANDWRLAAISVAAGSAKP